MFVDAVSNVLSTFTDNSTLVLSPKSNARFDGTVKGMHDYAKTTDNANLKVINLGPLQYGQSREIVVPITIPEGAAEYLNASITYIDRSTGDAVKVTEMAVGSEREATPESITAYCRSKAFDVGTQCITDAMANNMPTANNLMAEFVTELEELFTEAGEPDELKALKADVEGRMTKALDGYARFNRWGRHYLRSICRAHQLQVCTNFLDLGL